MNDEDLEVLITLDDPRHGPEEDVFHDLQPNDEHCAEALPKAISTA